mgnify:FL=1
MRIEQQNHRLIIHDGRSECWIDPWGKDSLRVRMSAEPGMDGHDWALTEPVEATDVVIRSEVIDTTDPWYKGDEWAKYHQTGTEWTLTNGKITAKISTEGWITFLNQRGEVLTAEYWRNRDRINRYCVPLRVPARELKPVPGGTDFSLTARFEAYDDEMIFGMGQYQDRHLNKKGSVLELAHRYPWVVAAVGIHPESLLPAVDCGEEGPAPTVSVYGGDWAAEMRALAPYYEDPKVVAVGECGLDYHWPVPKDAQLAMFEAHIRLALELDKPIIVHDRNAHADVYALLKKYQPKGIVHCYSGSADDAVWLAKQGLFIGFGGACTFKGAKRAAKAISALPLESIVLETDCPYMAPEPVRGTRCDSSLIRYVGEYIAQLRGISAEEVFRTTAENARRVYGL